MDEFGGSSSQIMFENVPKNLDFAPNSVYYENQFIFPHRMAITESAPAEKQTTTKKSETK